MTALIEPCKVFGDFVEEVQHCTDRGKGLEQLSTRGLVSLLIIRNIGYNIFDVTEKAKTDAAKARNAFDEKTLVLQNLLYESGYYQKEIQEARDYKSAVSDADMELMSMEEFQAAAGAAVTADLDPSSAGFEHQLMLRRLEHELQSRKQARQQLSELKARRDALHTNLGQKRKALTDLHRHASHINESTQDVRKLFALPSTTTQHHDQLAQLLPLPLYFIYSQATAVRDTLSTPVTSEVVGSKEAAEAELASGSRPLPSQPARKKQKRSASVGSATEGDLYQAFPLTVKLHLSDLSLTVTFAYLPALGVVTAEASGQAHNELLATLFNDDRGEDTPNVANKYLEEGSFVYDTRATARPYRWAQWLAGLDFLPVLPAGLFVQGAVSQETLQEAVSSYSRERRAVHILTTLAKRAGDASELGQQLLALASKSVPLQFPNRLFHHVPTATLQVWQELPRQAWPASVAAPKAGPSSTADKPDRVVEDPEEGEEGEEGELADAPQASADGIKSEEGEEAMDIDGQGAVAQKSSEAPVQQSYTDDEGQLVWGMPSPNASFRMFKLMVKSRGWQLDGHVQVFNSYPEVAPRVAVTAIKESYNPARHVKAGSYQRAELSSQDTSRVQTQANKEILSKLSEQEQSHVLSYQVAQLLVSLVEQTRDRETGTSIATTTNAAAAPSMHAAADAPAALEEADAIGSQSAKTSNRQRV